jgi:hypothetical protein
MSIFTRGNSGVDSRLRTQSLMFKTDKIIGSCCALRCVFADMIRAISISAGDQFQ